MATLRDSAAVTRVDTDVQAQIATNLDDYDIVVAEAAKATKLETSLGPWETFKTHKRAAMWSIIVSSCIIMEGWDCMLYGNFFGQPAFRKRFGTLGSSGTYQIPAPWQAGLSNGSNVGQLMGLWMTGIACDRFGYRKTIAASLAAVAAFIFIPVFAQSLPVLLIGQILMGVPLGVFQTLTTAYAAEVCPCGLRQYLTAYVNLCWVIGQLMVTGCLRAVFTWDTALAYRLPFALQWMWPVPIFIACWLAPESPWYLVRKGRLDEAERSIRRLCDDELTSQQVSEKLNMVRYTNEMERSVNEGMSYLDCFRGPNARRTIIVFTVWLIQQTCGSSFMGYSTYFLQAAGLPDVQAANFTVVQFAIAFLGTISSFFTLTKFGRRSLYFYGQSAMATLMLVIGIMGFFVTGDVGLSWATGALLLVFAGFYQSTVGPVCYVIIAETPSTRMRAKSVVIGRLGYNVAGIILNVVTPYWLNPNTSSYLGSKSALIWAGCGIIATVWTFFCLPETRGRTYGELDVLFDNKVSARKFSSTKVDQFAGAERLAAQRAYQGGEKLSHSDSGSSIKEKSSAVNVVATLDA